MQIDSAIGRTIAIKRRRAGLTQLALSQRIGCHRTHLAMIETGRANPSRKLLAVIDDVLNITRDRSGCRPGRPRLWPRPRRKPGSL